MLTPAQRYAKEAATRYFLRPPIAATAAIGGVAGSISPTAKNIIGLGIGAKVTAGTIISGQDVVRVYVRVKMPLSQLAAAHIVPAQFESLPTDVIEVGDITASQSLQTWQRFGRHRPLSCGVSVGHPNVTAGTLGCLVEKNGTRYILSNNHVLADSNGAQANDRIIQPGAADGGASPSDDIATLEPYKAIDFSGQPNDIDAAIAEVGPATQQTVEPEIIDVGRPGRTPKTAKLYQSVRKHGRTTGHTVGVIMDLSASLWVGYRVGNANQSAWFEDQIAIQGVGAAPFSQPGDSGSLIVDAVDLEPVALLFAGGGTLTFANPIKAVLTYYGVNVV